VCDDDLHCRIAFHDRETASRRSTRGCGLIQGLKRSASATGASSPRTKDKDLAQAARRVE